MHALNVTQLIADLLVVLSAGLISGLFCKRFGASLLVGYLLVGSIIGSGGLQLVHAQGHDIQLLAEVGALLLLFAIGIEFSGDELVKISRYFFVGGTVQMVLTAVPLTLVSHLLGLSWNGAILVGSAGALSSTVLVFRALSELGETASPHGRRAIGILLFQDAALVPLLLLVPLLTEHGEQPSLSTYAVLAAKSLLFVAGVLVAHRLVNRYCVPLLSQLRSIEIIVLFTLCLLGGVCGCAIRLGLPPAVGALAAGIALSGNRLSKQIDTIVLPFRETFAAVFFVTLGMLLQPLAFLNEPIALTAGLVGIVALKTAAATVAMRCVGLDWRVALGMGLGLAQLGEFSFLLAATGVSEQLISPEDFNRMLFIAMGTLVLTPLFLRWGSRWTGKTSPEPPPLHTAGLPTAPPECNALVIGIGPIGRQVSSRLELMGVRIHLLDLSPVNLYPFAQMGFATYSGDAQDPQVLQTAGADRCQLAVVCVPVDDIAVQVVKSLRDVNKQLRIVVRCRFQIRVSELEKAGATRVISEETEASGPLVRLCEELIRESAHGETQLATERRRNFFASTTGKKSRKKKR